MRIILSVAFAMLAFTSFASPAEAANARFFGPIVADECYCDNGSTGNGNTLEVSAPDFGCVLQTAQNTMNFLISLGVIIAILYTVFVGYSFMTSMGNPGALEKAKTRFGSLLLGMFLILGAWLIVDFIMKELYKPESSSGTVELGPWNAILESDAGTQCLKPSPDTPSIAEVVGGTAGVNSSSGSPVGVGSNCPAADPSSMVAFPSEAVSGGAEKASAETVRNFLAMRAAALQDGIDLKVTDGYRPESEQLELWERYNHDTRRVGKPCTLGGNGSNHNRGVALDIDVDCAVTNSNCDSAKFRWLKANGGRYGFYNNLPNDVVHWSPSGR